jgi:hypothetical protein
MRALLNDCSNNVFVIRNSRGKVFQVIGKYIDGHYYWMETFLCDMEKHPEYVMPGIRLKNIPVHLMKKYFDLMKRV